MSEHSGKGESSSNLRDPAIKEQEIKGHRGSDAHGGDVAAPNDDQAGRRQSPQSGPPSHR